MDEMTAQQARDLLELQVQELVDDLTDVLKDHRDKGVSIEAVAPALANLTLSYMNGTCSGAKEKARFVAFLVAFLTQHAKIDPVTRKDVPVIVKQ